MMPPTQRERVIAQINHEETDLVPYHLMFDPGSNIEERVDAYFGDNSWRKQIKNAIYQVSLPSLGINLDLGKRTYKDAYGSVWRLDLRPFSLETPALSQPSLDGYAFPELDQLFDPDWETRVLKEIEDNKDVFTVAAYGFGLFERSWVLRGFENVLMDVAINADFYEELLDKLLEHQMAILERLLKLPVDGIWFFDDWGFQQGILIGAERWRHLFKPRYEKLYQRTHEAGKYVLSHCCGGIVQILPDVIEIGLDVYQSVQPEAKNNNPYDLKQNFGDHITFWGGLGSQKMIPFGSPAEIKAEVRNLCKNMSKNGGYILGPAKEIQPETPDENIAAVVEAFIEQSEGS
jgi:uroporphyrinogen decarboxylase